MQSSPPVAALRIANEAFLVSSTIERCPKTMMIRELVVNAVEAARQAKGEKRVQILSVPIDGVPKLCIRNTGPGMSSLELDRICDLASSLNKVNSLDENFGMGAKVASLPSNKHGLRYRSCKDGVVSEVILGQRDGVYGRLRRAAGGDDGALLDVVDATIDARSEGLDISNDWTEVVLIGNRAEQNTVTDPYDGNPRLGSDWLANNLLLRFFCFPDDVTITLASSVVGGGPDTAVRTLATDFAPAGKLETVRTPSGVVIHYRYDPAESGSAASLAADGSASPGGLGCIIFKDEIYDPRTEKRWPLEAPAYGVSFGAQHISVFVELPDDYMVRPEAYRQFLRFRGGDQRQVFLQDFAPLITAYLPAWLKAIIRSYGPQQAKFLDELTDELRALVEELHIAPEFALLPSLPEVRNLGQPAQPGDASNKLTKQQDSDKPSSAPPPPTQRYERPPEIIGLDNEALIEERGLKGRAAKFYPSSHQLFVNLLYPSVTAVADSLEAEFHKLSDIERIRLLARSVAGWAITRRLARALVYSLSKKSAGWPAEDVKRAQSPESLSLVADDWSTVIEAARGRMEEQCAEMSGSASRTPKLASVQRAA